MGVAGARPWAAFGASESIRGGYAPGWLGAASAHTLLQSQQHSLGVVEKAPLQRLVASGSVVRMAFGASCEG